MKILQDLNGKTLTARNGKVVKITSIVGFQSTLPVPAKAPMDEPAELQESVRFTTESNLFLPPNKSFF